MFGSGDTIAAVGTPRGVSALGIVRLSGPDTSDILLCCLKKNKSTNPPNSVLDSISVDKSNSHHAYHGLWVDPATSEVLDEVVALYFGKGRGYTGEESAEIICHGSPAVIESVLKSMLEAGARLAMPGEFSFRAVINDRIDIIQAENVLQLIHARSPVAAKRALAQIRGVLSQRLKRIESDVVLVLANLEASIDFTGEDIQPVDFSKLSQILQTSKAEVELLKNSYKNSDSINRGLRVALLGKPNSGKSSLLNSLVGHKKSIVSSEAGTTRDLVEADILIDGFLLRLVDTAGVRMALTDSERQGIELSMDELNLADHILYIVDSSLGLQNDDVEILKMLSPKKVTICFNKNDLTASKSCSLPSNFGLDQYRSISCSAISPHGCEMIHEVFTKRLLAFSVDSHDFDVSTARQHELLDILLRSLVESLDLLEKKASPEFTAVALRDGHRSLASLLGKDIEDDVMNRVFKEFCIGK